MKKIFYEDEVLITYEKNDEWDKCVIYLENMLKKNPTKKEVLLSLAAYSWYVLTFWEYGVNNEELEHQLFKSTLEKTVNIFLTSWKEDIECACIFGYFMSINQYDFVFLNEDISVIEKKGESLIQYAYQKEPTNLLAKSLFLSEILNDREYKAFIKKVRHEIEEFFSGELEVDEYFLEIFS